LRGILGGSGLTIQRRDAVLERMVAMGTIDRSQADAVRKSSHLNLSPMACKSIEQTKAPYFYNYVEEELKALLGENIAQEGNMVVETALDLKMQEKAEAALALTISSEGGKHKFTQGGLVTLDSNTGLVKAMVGGFDFAKSAYNRTTAQRQPGSTFKLFAYTAAIESGILPTKTYSCEPMNWEKRDFPGCEHGASGYPDMTTGFALSENITALRVAKDVGLPNVIKTAEKMGVESDLKQKPALVLGESVVTLMEMTGAYSSIASRGVWHKPSAILRVYDTSDCKDRANVRTCRILYDGIKELQATRKVFEPNIANTMTTLMRGVVTKGTGKNASITGMNVAGKTGTTNDNVDLWFIGFVVGKPEVTGIWLGNDDNSPTQGTSAQSAQAWSNYMSSVYR
jgi:membrane peptidoglycan carboxypeptidase